MYFSLAYRMVAGKYKHKQLQRPINIGLRQVIRNE